MASTAFTPLYEPQRLADPTNWMRGRRAMASEIYRRQSCRTAAAVTTDDGDTGDGGPTHLWLQISSSRTTAQVDVHPGTTGTNPELHAKVRPSGSSVAET